MAADARRKWRWHDHHRSRDGRTRVLVADDEPLARERLRMLLGARRLGRDGRRVPERHTKRSTRSRRSQPDLVFLDVQMPGATGFEVIEAIGPARMPPVVFVTAYDRYALRAFDVRALDYLLKPFDRDRFQQALGRARQQLQQQSQGELERRLLELVNDLREPPQRVDRFVVKSGGRVYFVRTEEIDWIEAAGNYVKLHVGGEAHLLRETMTAIEAQLDPDVVLPDPSLPHREHRAGARAAAVVQRRVRGVPADRRAPDAEPRLSREASAAARRRALTQVACRLTPTPPCRDRQADRLGFGASCSKSSTWTARPVRLAPLDHAFLDQPRQAFLERERAVACA